MFITALAGGLATALTTNVVEGAEGHATHTQELKIEAEHEENQKRIREAAVYDAVYDWLVKGPELGHGLLPSSLEKT